MMLVNTFTTADETPVINLWKSCGLLYSHNDPHKDIIRKLTVQADLFLVGKVDDQLIGSVMAGYDGHRGWLNYLAIHPDYQGRGFGRKIVKEAEQRLRELGCPKINIQIRTQNAAAMIFYRKIGFITDDVISMGKRLISDAPPAN